MFHAICETENNDVLRAVCRKMHPQDVDSSSHLHTDITPDQLGTVLMEILAG